MGVLENQKKNAVNSTKFFFHVPKPRKTLIYLLAWSFIAGLVSRALYGKISVGGLVVFGGADGILLLALPALFAALLTAGFASPRDVRSAFRYYLFLAFAAAVLASIGYATGIAANKFVGFDLMIAFLVTNALVAGLWFLVSLIALNAKWRAAPISLLQPFFNLAFLFFWTRTSSLEAGLVIESPFLTGLKLLLATAVLLVALWSLFYVINAPAKRNLGVSAIQAATLFFAQTIRGSKDFEQVLEEMGEPVAAPVRAFSFRSIAGGKPKALFVVPSLHYGPFGNIGGSEYPARLSAELGQRHGRVFVFHGLVNHDFNPVKSSDYELVARTIEAALKKAERDGNALRTAGFFESRFGASDVSGFLFGRKSGETRRDGERDENGESAFATISRYPESTEDFDFGLGEALRNACSARLRAECVLADRHNCLTDGTEISAGSEAFAEYEEAVRRTRKPEKLRAFKLGAAESAETGFTPQQGIGRAGVRCAVFEIERKRYCLVLVDANNCLPEFKEEVVLSLKRRFGFDWIEIATSDTHAVNSLAGVYNPLPGGAPNKELIKKIEHAAALALRDLEPCAAFYAEERVRLDVMGAESQSEMLSTLNAIIAVAKILAPLVLIGSMLLVIAALLVWK